MNKAQVYEYLPYDLSGSRSKNRFRNELLWGMEKIFELYDEKEFCVVFDYFCDIEVYLENSFEFYQIKTSNKGNSFTISKLCNPDKQGNSILGKVYSLKANIEKADSNNFKDIKICVVANIPLRTLEKKLESSIRELNLSNLKEKSKNTIISSLQAELSLENVDLDNTYYIYSTMNLFDPENDLIGKIVKFTKKIFGKEPTNILNLYNTLFTIISNKACYECKCQSYEELKSKKGFTKEDFNRIIQSYINVSNNYISVCKNIVDKYYPGFIDNFKINTSLKNIYLRIQSDKILINLENLIVIYIKNHEKNLNKDLNEVINIILKQFSNKFNIEHTEPERIALIIIILVKYKENSYE